MTTAKIVPRNIWRLELRRNESRNTGNLRSKFSKTTNRCNYQIIKTQERKHTGMHVDGNEANGYVFSIKHMCQIAAVEYVSDVQERDILA